MKEYLTDLDSEFLNIILSLNLKKNQAIDILILKDNKIECFQDFEND